ncbi:MAG: hypothetical protein K9K39_06985 [Desulfohalobiaceae bacterium]|nr:hypothetical protein [Desulfohalobiaceae bacterium]
MQDIEIRAYGVLLPAFKASQSKLRDLPPNAEFPLVELLNRLNIPQVQVQLVMLNHRPVKMDALVRTGDRVALFPQEYPIFVDWKDYRLV